MSKAMNGSFELTSGESKDDGNHDDNQVRHKEQRDDQPEGDAFDDTAKFVLEGTTAIGCDQ
jgi:hypothetical protein